MNIIDYADLVAQVSEYKEVMVWLAEEVGVDPSLPPAEIASQVVEILGRCLDIIGQAAEMSVPPIGNN